MNKFKLKVLNLTNINNNQKSNLIMKSNIGRDPLKNSLQNN